jgi:carbon-monoxide dehydrogenase large subunit
VVAEIFRNQRIASAHMEPRAAIGAYDRAQGIYTVVTGSQGAVRVRNTIAACLGVPPERVRAMTHDVGGAFGLLNNVYPEQVMVTWGAKQFGQPVKWTGDRSQAFLADYPGRDLITEGRLALDADGRILALAITT